MKLVASLIVKNEMGRYLEPCIDHLQSYVDEIRALDDGSDDGSYEFLVERGVRVKRNTGPSFYEYESMARNMLLDWTYDSKPDYVLSIDADEFVGDPSLLRIAMNSRQYAYTLKMEEVWDATPEALEIRIDGQWSPRACPILWNVPPHLSFPNWHVMDRKLACGREPAAIRKLRSIPSNTSVFHFGWANRSEREARAERYFRHDGGKFHQDRHLQSILWPDKLVRTRPRGWPEGLSDLVDSLVDRATKTRA